MTYYDEIAEGYEELHREEQLKKLNFIKEINDTIYIDRTKKLLDVGCGTGLTTVFWDAQSFGIDPAIRLLERSHKGPVYVNAEGEHIPFKDNSFDIVVSVTALQNFHDIEKGLKEMKRVGKKDFIISFLKESDKKELILSLIDKYFKIVKIVEEDKDIVCFLIPLTN